MRLSRTEEKLMNLIWESKPIFLKELMEKIPKPKPAQTTVATLLKRMQEKGFVSYKIIGNARQYFPVVEKSQHLSTHVKGIIKNSFGNSSIQFASFFTTAAELSTKELLELREIIDLEIKKKRK